MQDTLRKLRSIANDATLNPAQKARYLSLEAGASEEPRRVIAIYAELFRAWLAGTPTRCCR